MLGKLNFGRKPSGSFGLPLSKIHLGFCTGSQGRGSSKSLWAVSLSPSCPSGVCRKVLMYGQIEIMLYHWLSVTLTNPFTPSCHTSPSVMGNFCWWILFVFFFFTRKKFCITKWKTILCIFSIFSGLAVHVTHLCKTKNNQLTVKVSFVGRISPFTKLLSFLFVNKIPSCIPLVSRLNRASWKWLSFPKTITKAILNTLYL